MWGKETRIPGMCATPSRRAAACASIARVRVPGLMAEALAAAAGVAGEACGMRMDSRRGGCAISAAYCLGLGFRV